MNVVIRNSPYAFIAYTYFLIGAIDNGFSYIYNAIEEGITLNSLCPQLNYPRSAPVYLTASLSSNPRNIMYPIVHEMRSELEALLTSYRKTFGSKFDIEELDKKFLQNIEIDTIKYYFVLTYWNIFEYRRKVRSEMMKNEFSKLRNVNLIFSLCLVIDKLLNYKYKTEYISGGVKEYSRTNELMTEQDLNSFLKLEKISGEYPDFIIPKLLAPNLSFNDVPISKQLKYLLIAYNLRNFASHNIQSQDVVVDNFEELIKILLYDIFLIIEEL